MYVPLYTKLNTMCFWGRDVRNEYNDEEETLQNDYCRCQKRMKVKLIAFLFFSFLLYKTLYLYFLLY